ncbi:MAG: helix-turn-helix transcriptional regulator [Pyrinomonadaceae bacterium]
MHTLSKELVSTIGHLYDIAHETGLEVWTSAYERLAKDFDADGLGAITIFDRSTDRMISLEGRLDHTIVPEYLSELQFVSPFRHRVAQLKVGERFNRIEMLSDEEFLNHPTYEIFYKRVGIFQLEYRVFLEDGPIHAGISLARTEGRPNFSAADLAALDVVLPHLARAFRLRFRIEHVYKQNDMITSLIDRLPGGVMVIDEKKRLEYSNVAAAEMLAALDGLRTNGDKILVADRAAKEKELKRAIELVLDDTNEATPNEVSVSIDRASGKQRYELLLMRLKTVDGSPFPGKPMVSIFVSDASYEPNQDGEMLTKIYDMTAAESRVAMMLAGGRSLNQIADDLSISKHTARTHLKRILSKTNTHSQGELIRLLLTGPAGLRPAPQ